MQGAETTCTLVHMEQEQRSRTQILCILTVHHFANRGVRADKTIQSTVRRIGVIFRFTALLSSKYARFFCILPPCEGKKFFSSRRFLLKYPLPAVKYAHKVILSIQRTALQSRLNRQICETHCTLVVLSKRVRLIKNAQFFKNYC